MNEEGKELFGFEVLFLGFVFCALLAIAIVGIGSIAYWFIPDIKVATYVASGMSIMSLALFVKHFNLIDAEPDDTIRNFEIKTMFGTSDNTRKVTLD